MQYDQVAALLADTNPDRPVICLRPKILESVAVHFTSLFPGDVLYAVKCNPHIEVLRALFSGGIKHFDTASINEVKLIHNLFGNEAEAHFNHPVKSRSAIIESSSQYNIKKFVVDSEDEIHKIISCADLSKIQISVRLATPPGEAVQHMSSKFGAEPNEASRLLRFIRALDIPAGIAFHVGSQCRDPNDYYHAISLAAVVRDQSGVEVDTINVGGGFPIQYLDDSVPTEESFINRICEGIEDFEFSNSRLQCEPGRGLVADSCSIITQVHLRKEDSLYINDGIFGNLCELVYLKIRVPMRTFRGTSPVPGTVTDFKLYGPTCDPVDVLPGVWALPDSIKEGDWIEFGQTGAYSSAITTKFNGFTTDDFVQIDEEPFWTINDQMEAQRQRIA